MTLDTDTLRTLDEVEAFVARLGRYSPSAGTLSSTPRDLLGRGMSVRTDRTWRIVFRAQGKDVFDVDLIDCA